MSRPGITPSVALKGMAMHTHKIITEFARQYGVKEGLVLTELCRRMLASKAASIPFSVSTGVKYFSCMSAKQVRLSLKNLVEKGGISVDKEKKQSVDRTSHYTIARWAYQHYLEIYRERQQFFLEHFGQIPGDM
jgi:hypothetical protein